MNHKWRKKEKQYYISKSLTYKEIHLSDPRKVESDKLKAVLRF